MGVLVFGFVYVDGGCNRIFHPIQSTPIIKQYHTYNTVQVVEPPKRVLVEREVCNRIDGCPVVKGVCESCEIVKR